MSRLHHADVENSSAEPKDLGGAGTKVGTNAIVTKRLTVRFAQSVELPEAACPNLVFQADYTVQMYDVVVPYLSC